MRFLIYKDAEGEWRWRLVAANGNILGDSGQGYKGSVTKVTDRVRSLVEGIRSAGDIEVHDLINQRIEKI